MGRESALTIYRVHKDGVLSDSDIEKFRKAYADYRIKHEYSFTEDAAEDENRICRYMNDIPAVADRRIFSADPFNCVENSVSDRRDRFYIEWRPADVVSEFWFTSCFCELWDEYNLGRDGSWKNELVVITKYECEKILQAVKYLLSGEYSRKTENILNNRWIAIFGKNYSRYTGNRNRSVYAERIDRGSYRLTFGDDEWEREIKTADSEKEAVFDRVRLAMEIALHDESN